MLDERAHASAIRSIHSGWSGSSRSACPADAIITSDSGSCANWYARDLKIRRGMMCSLSGGLASMGAAVPYAIAAKYAHPDRPVIALVGDSAMQMNNMAELITVVEVLARVAESQMGGMRFQRSRPEPGHLGAAGARGRSQIRCIPTTARRALLQVRRADWLARYPCRGSGGIGRSVGSRAPLRQAGGAGSAHGPERPAAAAARDAHAGAPLHVPR